MRGNGQNRGHAPVGIEQPVDEVQVPRATAPRAYRQFACQLCFGASGESGSLFVTDMNPLDLATAVQSVDYRVETVTHEPINTLDTGFGQNLNQCICNSSGHGKHSPQPIAIGN
jgi:hypothetical protein